MSLAIQRPAMCIVLSGLPCTGKSTWSDRFIAKSKLNGLSVRVISSDTISYQICDEYNKHNREQLNYATVWNHHRQEIEDKYQSEIDQVKAGNNVDVVIFDRTYTTIEARAKALQLANGIQRVHLLSMQILNETSWNNNLLERNKNLPNKTITQAILDKLKSGATPPAETEGFHSIVRCPAIGEPGWENVFESSIDEMIKNAMNN